MNKIIRRILCALILASLICAMLLPAAGLAAVEARNVEALLSGMSLRDKIAQMMIVAPRTWQEETDGAEDAKPENITELNDALRGFFARNRFGAVILYAENCRDAEQMLRLTADMQQTTVDAGGVPMFVAIDQEGGSVSRLTFGTSGPGSMALAATGDPENARAMARVYGEELALVGVNVDYAPDVDVNDNPANPVIGVRSFGDAAETVAEFGVAYMKGLQDANVVATVKHFPGHGNTDVDSHTGLPLVDRGLDELIENELVPFKAAVDAGAEMVMTAHIQFPQIEAEKYVSTSTGEEVYIPATMSKTILTGILRGELKFDGVIVSDALEMDAISKNYATDDVLVKCVNAGVNMLMLPHVADAESLKAVEDMVDRAVELAEDGSIEIERVDDSVRRILNLKQAHGLLDQTDFTVTDERAAEAVSGAGSAEHRQLAWDIAVKGLTLLKNENDAFPMDVKPGETTLLLISAASRGAAAEHARQFLGELGEGLTGMVIEKDTAEACAEAAKAADHVLVVSRAWDLASMDPSTDDGFPVGVINQIIDDCHADGKPVTVISAQLPLDAACYPEADAILLAYCSSVTRSVPPAEGAGSAYVPNLPAAICACFGTETPGGRLPVNIPVLDENYKPTDEILCPRQIGADGGFIAQHDALPERDWQKVAAFPDWKGYTDDTLAMNGAIGFKGYRGQGTLWLEASDEVEGFSLYVNGEKFDIPGGGIWSVDIAGAAVNGTNDLQISNIRPLGLEQPVTVYIPYPTVLASDGGLEGIRPEALKLVKDIIAADIENGFTSAQLAVVKNGRLVVNAAWGTVNSADPDAPAVTTDTLYDLASVTKMFAANYAVMKLVTDGLLDVNTPIVDILGDAFADDTLDFAYEGVDDPGHEAQVAWKRALTVRDALCHHAGFPASPHYDDPSFDMAAQAVGAEGSNVCYARTREETLGAICRTPLYYAPGSKTVYSDVDYMLACFIVEKITGQRLDEYVKENLYAPLGLGRITFMPLENGFTKDDCAATELHGNTRDFRVNTPGIRTYTIQGEVHDERAWYCMGGVSGHAGLFASAADLARLASVMLTGGYGEHRCFSRNVIDLFTAPKSAASGQWGLGWYREGDDQRPWYFGTQASSGTVGQQGWTGTLAMIDPARELVIVYLTNKINSPVTSDANPNRFDGNWYTASSLGFVPQILSVGMDADADVTAQLDDLAADMAVESAKLVPEDAGPDHPSVKNVQSKLQILRARAAGDAEALAETLAQSVGLDRP